MVERLRAQEFGVKPGDVRRASAILLSGLAVGNLFEEQKVFDVVVWGTPEIRQSEANIENLLVDTPRIPWAIVPMPLLAFGIALVFPILTLAILDMHPRQRGAASSNQMFVGLVSHTLLAGAVSPLISHDPLWLCLGSAALSLAAWLLWRGYLRRTPVAPAANENAPAFEPTVRM